MILSYEVLLYARMSPVAISKVPIVVAVKVDTRYTSIPLFPKSTNVDGSIVTVTLNRK